MHKMTTIYAVNTHLFSQNEGVGHQMTELEGALWTHDIMKRVCSLEVTVFSVAKHAGG